MNRQPPETTSARPSAAPEPVAIWEGQPICLEPAGPPGPQARSPAQIGKIGSQAIALPGTTEELDYTLALQRGEQPVDLSAILGAQRQQRPARRATVEPNPVHGILQP